MNSSDEKHETAQDWLDQAALRSMRCRTVRTRKGFDCVPLEFCCPEMRGAWADDFVGYGPHDELCKEKETRLCIYQAQEFECGNVIWDRMPISFCPFCGGEILLK